MKIYVASTSQVFMMLIGILPRVLSWTSSICPPSIHQRCRIQPASSHLSSSSDYKPYMRRSSWSTVLYNKKGNIMVKEEEKVETKVSTSSPEETTQKYGLEAGLFQSLKSDDGGQSAKSLLKKYGIAYLATSIPLAIVSFTLCYVLVDNGVDVASLLSKVGINVASGDTGEKVGTFAIAYAAHKAASPIRFPPTVILTPIVAKIIGKEPDKSGLTEEQ